MSPTLNRNNPPKDWSTLTIPSPVKLDSSDYRATIEGRRLDYKQPANHICSIVKQHTKRVKATVMLKKNTLFTFLRDTIIDDPNTQYTSVDMTHIVRHAMSHFNIKYSRRRHHSLITDPAIPHPFHLPQSSPNMTNELGIFLLLIGHRTFPVHLHYTTIA